MIKRKVIKLLPKNTHHLNHNGANKIQYYSIQTTRGVLLNLWKLEHMAFYI